MRNENSILQARYLSEIRKIVNCGGTNVLMVVVFEENVKEKRWVNRQAFADIKQSCSESSAY